MNVLESYLAIPFLALLGCTETALRLPQLLCACLSLPVLYDLLRRMISRRAALIGLGLLCWVVYFVGTERFRIDPPEHIQGPLIETIVAELRGELPEHLRGQPDLGHEHDRAFALSQRLFDQL